MKKIILKLSLICFAACVFSMPVCAQTTDRAGFTVRAILPENQIDSGNTYFDLRMYPGESQELQVEVHNTADTDITLDISLHSASTNRNGIIEYLVENEPDETMKVPFSSIAETQPELALGPNEQKLVSIRVHMPEEEFDGTVLGGIVFTRRSEPGEAQGIGINNRFSYIIGVKLSETDKEIVPDFDLKSVQEALINYRTAVVANIRNLEPVIVKDARASAQVYRSDDQTPLFSVSKENVDFAPNSVLPLPVEWEGQRMEAGNYRISVQLAHEGETWNWDQDFSISSSQAKEINDNAVPLVPSPNQFGLFQILLFLLMLILLAIAFYIGRKSKRTRADEYSDGNKAP